MNTRREAPVRPYEPIAIIGMAGRFPGARDLDEFWRDLTEGRTSFTRFTREELLDGGEDPRCVDHPDYVPVVPVLDDIEYFDAELFGMTPREAQVRDPQYRIFLEIAHSVLEDGGYDPRRFPGRIGAYGGSNGNRYRIDSVEPADELVAAVGWEAVQFSNWPDHMTTFASYKLGLHGPSMAVQTACSTSLVAIHQACMALHAGECEMAIAGGVSVELPLSRGYMYVAGGLRAKDGYPRPFDKDTTGTNFGSGAGAVLLKELSAALADGDRVYAVIRGSAVNNDGERKAGYTAPSVGGQSACVAEALRRADADPASLSYIEAHATGTLLGDPIEMNALAEAFRLAGTGAPPPRSCAVGSVKGNIGHLSQAAGVAGLIKTVLALHHDRLPPTAGFRAPNPAFDFASSPFFVAGDLRPWPRGERPRRAGVSSFGIGGTNAHVVLEEAPPVGRPAPPPARPELVVWSAAGDGAEARLRASLAGHFAALPEDRFPDSAHTLRVGRTARKVRGAVVAEGAAEAGACLANGTIISGDGRRRDTVLSFPGQGALYPGIAHELYAEEPFFKRACDEAFEVLNDRLGFDLRARWLSGERLDEADTLTMQPLLFAIELSLARCLTRLGVRPRTVLGHGLGELVAATVAGVFGFEDGLRAVAARAELMSELPAGAMLAVAASADDIPGLLGGLRHGAGGEVTIAAVNGPRRTVLAGPHAVLAECGEELRAKGIVSRPLAVGHAFHSPAMRPAVKGFAEVIEGMALRLPQLALISCHTGQEVGERATSPQFWAEQIARPVWFAAAADTLFAGRRPPLVVEVAPPVLVRHLRSRPEVRDGTGYVTTALDARPGRDRAAFAELLGRLWVHHVPVDIGFREKHLGYRHTAVPGYPYQRRRHWIEASSERAMPADYALTGGASAQTPPPAAREAAPEAAPSAPYGLARIEWERSAPNGETREAEKQDRGPALTLLPDAGPLTETVRKALRKAGRQVRAVPSADDAALAAAFDAVGEATGPGPVSPGNGPVMVYGAALAAPDTVDTGSLDDQLEAGLYDLIAFSRACSRQQRRLRTPLTLIVLTRYGVDVSGAEPVNPVTAMAVGLLRTLEREARGIRCFIIDVGPGVTEDVLAAEFAAPHDPHVALRGTYRWLPRERPVSAPSAGGASSLLKEEGTYVITGGLGGLGLETAKTLAGTGLRPRIALVGRSGLGGAAPSGVAALDGLRAAGALVEVFAADVADPGSLGEALDAVAARFSDVDGVFHCAGVPGGGLLELRDRADIGKVLAPKVRGTLVLDEALRDRPDTDFVMYFSSRAGYDGLYGSADYAAANAFMDAVAVARRGHRVSVAWPAWSGVGMAARSEAPELFGGSETPVTGGDYSRVFAPGGSWEMDEHVIQGRRVLPATAIIELVITAALSEGLSGQGRPLEIEELTLLAPLLGDEEVRVHVSFEPEGERHRFQVRSCSPAGSEPRWRRHAGGTIRTAPVDVTEIKEPDRLRQVLRRGRSSPGTHSWIALGDRWNVKDTVIEQDGEWFAKLRVPDDFHGDFAHHILHPALLDIASFLGIPPLETFLPFLYRRFVWVAPLPPCVTVHWRTRNRTADTHEHDFDVFDHRDGRLLASATGFVMRRARPDQFLRSPEAGDDPGTAGTGAAAPIRAALTPHDGAAALRDLLARRHAPHVLVTLPDEGTTGPVRPDGHGAPGQEAPEREAVTGPEGTAGDMANVRTVIAEICADTLGVDHVGAGDDFFEAGGDSLAAVQVVSRVNAHYGLDLSAIVLFDGKTVESLAAEVLAVVMAPGEQLPAGTGGGK